MKFEQADCITVLGTRGTGKSTLARKISGAWPRKVIIDPINDWTEGLIVRSFNEFSLKLGQFKREEKRSFTIIFRFSPDDHNKEEILDEVLRLCFHFTDLQVIIDEVQLFASPQYVSTYLKNILFLGRHKKVSLMAITQRPSQLNKNILSQSAHVFAGQLHEKNDLRVISDFLQIETEKIINNKKGIFFWFRPTEKIELINLFKNKK